MKKIRLGQIGLGHWGPNLFRNFLEHEMVALEWVCDLSPERLKKISRFPVRTTCDYRELLAADNSLDAVVIATPVASHFTLVREALTAGKHVLVEKPLAHSAEECQILIDLATQNELILMVGHVFLFNPGIIYVRDEIARGALGEVHFVHGQRTNLGPIRTDVNASWDLASHDISIFNFWMNDTPVRASANGRRILSQDHEDIVTANLYYRNGVCCTILVSWLHPRKVRQLTVVGAQKMMIWDDIKINECIRIYDKGVDVIAPQEQVEGTFAEFRFSLREGDVSIPRIQMNEPLKAECYHFIDCLLHHRQPLTDGVLGLNVVKTLEAIDRSLNAAGASVEIS